MISPKFLFAGLVLVLLSGAFFTAYMLRSDIPSCLDLTVDRCTFSYGSTSVTFVAQGNLSREGLRFLLSNESASFAIDRPSFVFNESRSYTVTLPDPRIFDITRVQLVPFEQDARCASIDPVPCSPISVQPLGNPSPIINPPSSLPDSRGSSSSGSGSGSGSSSTAPSSNQAPTAHFIVSPLSGILPLEVTFDASNSSDDHGIVRYVWDFGDATLLINESDAFVVQHTYGNPGAYNATLAVFDADGLRSDYSIIIQVLAPSQCFDGLDNDNDEAIDSADYSCSLGHEFENSFMTECQDSIDNDGNSLIDFSADPGCVSSQDASEFSLPLDPAPLWGLVNNGLSIGSASWTRVSLASDSQENILTLFSDKITKSVYMGRFNVASKMWERSTQNGWSSNTNDYYKAVGSSSFGGGAYALTSGFSGSELFGLENALPKVGSGALLDMHANSFNVKLNPLTGSLVRWYNGSTYSSFNAQSIIWNHYGSFGGFARNSNTALFVKTIGKSPTTALNFTASRYDASLDTWGTWHNGIWNYTYPLASFQNSPLPLLASGELPARFSSYDAAVASIPYTDDFLVLYSVKQGPSKLLRAAFYNATNAQWFVWNNEWTTQYTAQQNLDSSTLDIIASDNPSVFYDNGTILFPYSTQDGWRLLRYVPSSATFDTLTLPFGLSSSSPVFSSDAQNVTWLAYRTGSSLYLLNYTSGTLSTPLLVSSNFTSAFFLIGIKFVGTTPFIYYQDPSGNVYVISNLNDPFWSSETSLSLIQTPTTASLDPLYGTPLKRWLTEAEITVNDSTNTPRTFMNAYGPVACGHIALDSELSIYCPHAATTAVIIYPFNYSSPLVSPYPEETARVWGNFWEYQLFPASVGVDNVRNKTYIIEASWWGGGAEAFPSGSVKIWDKSKKSDFVVNATFAAPPYFSQTYRPATLLVQNTRFNRPSDSAIDEDRGILYVTESANHRVNRFDLVNLQNGLPRYLGSFGSEGSGDGQFSYPQGIDVDSQGNVYVVDTENSRIEKFNSSGAFIQSWGGWGSEVGQFRYPFSIAVDKLKGYVYVSDPYNARLQIFDEHGNFIYAFGSVNATNSNDFDMLSGVAVYNNSLALAVKGESRYIQTIQMHLL